MFGAFPDVRVWRVLERRRRAIRPAHATRRWGGRGAQRGSPSSRRDAVLSARLDETHGVRSTPWPCVSSPSARDFPHHDFSARSPASRAHSPEQRPPRGTRAARRC